MSVNGTLAPETWVDPDYLYRAAKYVDKSFKLFDEKTAVAVSAPSAFGTLVEALKEFYEEGRSPTNTDE